jgi:hypothetical protein
MSATQGLTHETDRRLIGILSIAVEENTIQQAQGLVTTELAGLGVHPAAQSRLISALARHLTEALESITAQRPRFLTLRLYSMDASTPSAQGWGFFIVNKTLRPSRCILEIYVYREAPV